jgi:sortase A
MRLTEARVSTPHRERTVRLAEASIALLAGLALLAALTLLLLAPSHAPATLSTPQQVAPVGSTLAGPLPRAWATPPAAQPVESHATMTPEPTPPPVSTPPTPAEAQPAASDTPPATATMQPPAPITSTPTVEAAAQRIPAEADPTRIVAEAIGLDAAVVTVGTHEQIVDGIAVRVWDVADHAAGYHQGSARPGHVGNTVLTGHNNIAGEVFRELDGLQPGDEVLLYVDDVAYRYAVSATHRVAIGSPELDSDRDPLTWILPTADERLTLVTCWPYWSNTHRIIVVALPVAD